FDGPVSERREGFGETWSEAGRKRRLRNLLRSIGQAVRGERFRTNALIRSGCDLVGTSGSRIEYVGPAWAGLGSADDLHSLPRRGGIRCPVARSGRRFGRVPGGKPSCRRDDRSADVFGPAR